MILDREARSSLPGTGENLALSSVSVSSSNTPGCFNFSTIAFALDDSERRLPAGLIFSVERLRPLRIALMSSSVSWICIEPKASVRLLGCSLLRPGVAGADPEGLQGDAFGTGSSSVKGQPVRGWPARGRLHLEQWGTLRPGALTALVLESLDVSSWANWVVVVERVAGGILVGGREVETSL